jgi:hypothetical protein
MIRFNFTVSDADAENIFSIMCDRISTNNMRIIDLMGKPGQEHYIGAYRQDNEYVEGLIKKMTNTQVEE